MRKILLGTASALALGLFATAAMAGQDEFWGHNYGNNSSTDNTAVAVGAQINSVTNDGDIVIGSQAETHSKAVAASSKDDGKDHHNGGGYESYSQGGGYGGGGSSSSFFFASYDHNDQGLVTNSNKIDDSFGGATGLINVNQNNGNNVSQDAQNTVAAILGCDCGDSVGGHRGSNGGSDTDNVAVAVGLQASYVANGDWAKIVVDVADQSNLIKGSFNNATGLINVNQNNGNNVSQKAQNTVAAIIAKK
jgi:hypothetical protein